MEDLDEKQVKNLEIRFNNLTNLMLTFINHILVTKPYAEIINSIEEVEKLINELAEKEGDDWIEGFTKEIEKV